MKHDVRQLPEWRGSLWFIVKWPTIGKSGITIRDKENKVIYFNTKEAALAHANTLFGETD